MAKKLTGIEKARAAKAAKAAERAAAAQTMAIDDEPEIVREPVQRNIKRELPRQTPPREPLRTSSRGTVAQGRDGEQLSRKRTLSGDIFAIPDELVPTGWEYQWVAVSVIGNTEVLMDQNLLMAENGWRPVPAKRYPGRFMPAGYEGNITRGGQMLMERPKVLCDEARAEDLAAARQLVSDRNESLKLTQTKAQMPSGFEMSDRYKGTGGDIRMSIDAALDAPRPELKVVE